MTLYKQLINTVSQNNEIALEAKVHFLKSQSAIKIHHAINSENQLSKLKADSPEMYEKAFNGLLANTRLSLNVTNSFDTYQAYEMIQLITEKYWNLKFEELIYICKNGKMGMYGKTYNKLDIETLIDWIEGYFASAEYMGALEKENSKHKGQLLEKPITDAFKDTVSPDRFKELRKQVEQINKNKYSSKSNKKPITDNSFKQQISQIASKADDETLDGLLKHYRKSSWIDKGWYDAAFVVIQEMKKRKKNKSIVN